MEPVTPTPAPLSRREWGLASLGAVSLSAMVTWPMASDPAGAVLGHSEASVGCHVWVLWWAQQHLDGAHSDLLFFPNGADVVRLYGSDVLSPLLLRWLPVSPVLAYNLWVALLVVVGALGAWRLARRVGASASGAWVAGAVFGSAPFFQHELLNGTSELLAAGFLPWFAVALLDVLQRPSAGAGLRAGLLASAAVLSSVYNAFFLLIVAALITLHRVATRLGPAVWGAPGKAAAVGLGLTGMLVAPLGLMHLAHGAGETLARREDWLSQDPPLPDSFADLLDWVDPRAAELPAVVAGPMGETFEYWTTCTVYLGLVALVLAARGLWRSREGGPSMAPWAGMVFVGALIASGPVLRIGGDVWLDVPLVAPTLAYLFPPFVVTALHAYRYTAVVVLGLSVLAARGADRRWLAALVVAEALWLSPVPWPAHTTPAPDSPTLQYLAGLPDGAVLTLPAERDDLGDLGRVLMAQTAHGKPVHEGGIHRRAGAESTALFRDNPVLADVTRPGGARWPEPEVAAFGVRHLADKGYRYVLVAADAEEARSEVQRWLGPAVTGDTRWVLWELPAGE